MLVVVVPVVFLVGGLVHARREQRSVSFVGVLVAVSIALLFGVLVNGFVSWLGTGLVVGAIAAPVLRGVRSP